jgi:hypothetical protein
MVAIIRIKVIIITIIITNVKHMLMWFTRPTLATTVPDCTDSESALLAHKQPLAACPS